MYGLHLPGEGGGPSAWGLGAGPIYELAHLQELAHSNLAHSIGKCGRCNLPAAGERQVAPTFPLIGAHSNRAHSNRAHSNLAHSNLAHSNLAGVGWGGWGLGPIWTQNTPKFTLPNWLYIYRILMNGAKGIQRDRRRTKIQSLGLPIKWACPFNGLAHLMGLPI